MKVFVHVDAFGTYVGNGGFLLLTDLANQLANMRYDVSVFDASDSLEWEDFYWLCLSDIKFKIAPSDLIKISHKWGDFRVISAWLNALPRFLRRNLRYLESSELIRQGKQKERLFLIDNNVKIANLHPYLAPFYEKLGIRNMIDLPVWVDNRAKNTAEKTRNSVGIQLERKSSCFNLRKTYHVQPYKLLYDHFRNNIILCNGPYVDVLDKMQRADFYVHFPEPSPHIQLFKGETLGRPLFEAMACGCVCIARKHEGIRFLEGTIRLVSSMKEVLGVLEFLMRDEDAKETIRHDSLKLIEERYRFDRSREQAIKEWLE